MMQTREFSQLIASIYDASLDPSLWHEVLRNVCSILNAKAAAIQAFDPLNNANMRVSLEFGTNAKWQELLHSTYAALCPIGPIVLVADVDKPGSIFDYIDEQEFVETRFYREWCEPQGYYDFIGSMMSRRADEVSTFSIMGGHNRQRFSAKDLEFVGIVAPHVKRAMTIADIIQHRPVAVDGFEAVIDALPTSVVLVDDEGALIHANAAAQGIFSVGDLMRLNGNKVVFSNLAADRKLREALTATGQAPTLVSLPRPDGGILTAAIITRQNKGGAAIMLYEPKENLPAYGKHLITTFGFTPREIAVLMPLLEGRSLNEIAELLGVGITTVRTHVNKLLSKSNSERQADLVQKVIRVMPPIRMSR